MGIIVHVITYDLKSPGRDYDSLFKAIKNYTYWAHALESVWFIDTNDDVSRVRDNLGNYIDSNDVLFVCQLEHNWAAYRLSSEVADWLKNPSRNL